MEQSSQNENVARIENDLKKILPMKFLWIQNLPPFMKGCKSILKNCMLKECFGNFITYLHYAGYFYCVNNNKKVNGKVHGVMYCMFCYNSLVDASNLIRIQVVKE
jgi:hypothetical protein